MMTPLSPAGLLHDLLVPLRLHLHRRDRGIHAPGPGQRSPLITRVEHCVTASLHYTLLQASYFLFAVSTLMTKTSVCTDPIIYFWLNTQVCKIYWLVASYTMPISTYPQFVFAIPVSKRAAEFDRAAREGAKSVHDGDISHLLLHTTHHQVGRAERG